MNTDSNLNKDIKVSVYVTDILRSLVLKIGPITNPSKSKMSLESLKCYRSILQEKFPSIHWKIEEKSKSIMCYIHIPPVHELDEKIVRFFQTIFNPNLKKMNLDKLTFNFYSDNFYSEITEPVPDDLIDKDPNPNKSAIRVRERFLKNENNKEFDRAKAIESVEKLIKTFNGIGRGRERDLIIIDVDKKTFTLPNLYFSKSIDGKGGLFCMKKDGGAFLKMFSSFVSENEEKSSLVKPKYFHVQKEEKNKNGGLIESKENIYNKNVDSYFSEISQITADLCKLNTSSKEVKNEIKNVRKRLSELLKTQKEIKSKINEKNKNLLYLVTERDNRKNKMTAELLEMQPVEEKICTEADELINDSTEDVMDFYTFNNNNNNNEDDGILLIKKENNI